MKASVRTLLRALGMSTLLLSAWVTWADELPEYRLKAAFLYNFALFTEWPAEVGSTVTLCIHGNDPFGKEIDGLNGKVVGGRSIAVRRDVRLQVLRECQVVFIAASASGDLPRVLDELRDKPVLTVADSQGAGRRGVVLNMTVAQNKITFEANLQAARAVRLNLSSKLLRLATEVIQ
jgi:YfiR/HmsC-like